VSQACIVVGTDLSAAASEAIRQGASWSARERAPLLVVHVAPDELFAALETPKVVDALRERAAAYVHADIGYDVVLVAGSPHGELVREADRRGAMLLVVGASGADSVERALFGSTAEQVVRYAHCPVLVTRPSPDTGPILAVTDFSTEATSGIEVAVREAKSRGVPLHLLHSIYEPRSSLSLLGPLIVSGPAIPAANREALARTAREMLETQLEAARVPGGVTVAWGPPAEAVAGQARKLGAGLVVVATRGRTGLARIALGSVAAAIVRSAPCSVLAVRRQGGRKPEQ
jgi:nucleotide-binding universal stress UspA family protein